MRLRERNGVTLTELYLKRELDEYMEKLLNRIASFNTESVRSAKEALQLTT